MNSKYLIRTTLVLSIILMVILLPLDAYCANDGCTKSYVSLVFGIFGIFIGGNETLTWYANPLLFLAWLFLLIRKPKLSLILSIVSTLVALSFLTFDEIVINEAGHQAPITKYALGYWLWIGSHTIMVIGNVFILLYEHHSSFKKHLIYEEKAMQQTLKQIETVLEEKIPQFIKMLNPPATESDFEALEAVIGSKLPEAFKTFYRWHNGQNRSPYVAFHIETHEILMPIKEIIEWYEELSGQLDYGDIEEQRWRKIWVPFTDNGSGDATCIDISKENFGQIVIQDGWEDDVKVIFDSLEEWLQDLLNKMKDFDYSTWVYLDRL